MTGAGIASGPARSLPSGTVTFLFTDIEGSTRILRRLPDLAPSLFERHREIVRRAIADNAGCEVSTEGDSFFVAFDDVDDAVAASAQLQRDLAREPWPVDGEIRVRAGVHSGLAVPRNDNYISLAVHQAARIASTAHGGQTVATRSTLDRRKRPSPARDVSVGRCRVRDFDDPVELVRLDAIEAPVVEHALRAVPAENHNFVRSPTSFVGRRSALDGIAAAIAPGTIVSIVGPGGTGKTRLATEIALEHASEWDDGVWLVELAEVTDTALVASTIADAIGFGPAPDADVASEVADYLRTRRTLLIVDNIESCIDACAGLLPQLAASGAAVLTTSREPMNIPGERVWRLDPLDVAAPGSTPEEIRRSPAVELFIDRATVAVVDFDPDADLADIARVCARLDGIPLAIEIAAARAKVLSVAEILDGLSDRFTLLRSDERNRPERQRTLRGLLQWSYDLLDNDSQAALRRLAAFAGSFTLRAAVIAVADPRSPTALDTASGPTLLAADDAPELVWGLVDKSLVVLDRSGTGTRYRLLESIREFAHELLVESGESTDVVERVARDLLDVVGPWCPADRRWLGDMAVEAANVRGVIDPLAEIDQELAQSAVCSLGRYYDATQRFEVGIAELTPWEPTLAEWTPTRPVMLATLADLHLRRGDHARASQLVVDADEVRAVVGTPPWAVASIERTQGEILLRTGDFEGAAAVAHRTLARTDLAPAESARMWNLLGIASLSVGDHEAGQAAFRRELDAYVELDLTTKLAAAYGNVAEAALRLGDTHSAAVHQLASLDAALMVGQPVMVAFAAVVAAHLAGALGDWPTVVRLHAAAESALAAAGHPLYDTDADSFALLFDDATAYVAAAADVAAETSAGAELDSVAIAALTRQVLEQVIARRDDPNSLQSTKGSV